MSMVSQRHKLQMERRQLLNKTPKTRLQMQWNHLQELPAYQICYCKAGQPTMCPPPPPLFQTLLPTLHLQKPSPQTQLPQLQTFHQNPTDKLLPLPQRTNFLMGTIFQQDQYYQNVNNIILLFLYQCYSSILKFIKCFRIPLVLTTVQFALLILVVIQYIALDSNQQLIKNHQPVLRNQAHLVEVPATGFLVALPLISPNPYYQFHIFRTGHQIVKEQHIVFACPTFKDVLSVYHLAAIQTLLWIPLKIVALVKPQGSIVNKNDSMTFAQKYSRACYCCCGAIINYLHKFSINPFLVVTLQPSFEDLDSSLEIVQETYHRADPAFDKSSLWLYRLSSYINIAFLSMAFVTLDSHASNPFALSSFANWFFVLGVVVTVEIGQYFLTLWSL